MSKPEPDIWVEVSCRECLHKMRVIVQNSPFVVKLDEKTTRLYWDARGPITEVAFVCVACLSKLAGPMGLPANAVGVRGRTGGAA